MNIYAKLTLLCVFLVVFTSWVLYFVANQQIERAFRQELLVNITRQAEATVTNIERFTFSRLNDVRMAARNPYVRITDISSDELTERLQELESLNDLYYSFSFFNNERVKVADSKQESLGEKHPNSSYWTKLNSNTDAVMDVAPSTSTDRVFLYFAAVVTDYFEDQPIGVLVGQVPIDELYRIMGNISLAKDSTRVLNVTLINDEGVILYANDPAKKPLKDLFGQKDLIFGSRNSSNKSVVSLIETDEELYFVTNQSGAQSYAGNDWSLVISIDKEAAFLPIRQIQRQLLWTILIVLVSAILLALIAANIFVRPIIKLSKAAEEISKGNFNAEIKAYTKDEVGKLATQLSRASQVLIKRLEEQRKLNQKLEDQKNEIATQKLQLEQANRQVSDSIVYAQRIQKSILPELSVISKLVQDVFVMYEPKDVVSGDFYWFERVRQGRNEYLIVACADCTGHGVPGAIMSIMGSNQLTNIVYYQNYLDPNKILARLDKVIKFELQRDNEDSRDGLEIGICVINLDDLTMEFSGAGIPLMLIKKGTREIQTLKSPKYMIGGIEGDEKEVGNKLSKETVQLEPGDKLYLATDGYQDQFGGPDDRKFMSRNFNQQLVENSDKPMDEQLQILQRSFKEWKKETPQTDDVLVIGVEV